MKVIKHQAVLFVFVCGSLICQSGLIAQSTALLPESQLDGIIEEVSGERAWWHVNALAQFHRIEKSKDYHRAAEYVVQQARSIGLKEIEIEKFVADGKTWNFMFRTDPAWEPEKGVLWIEEPFREKLADFDEIRVSLATNSRHTDVTAELVDVGTGLDQSEYEGVDVRGKIVLASGDPRSVQRHAVFGRGALGVLSYYTIAWMQTRQPGDFPDQVTWSSIDPADEAGNPGGFAFMLSYRNGMRLKRLLAAGTRVMMRAVVRARVESGFYEVVSALIPGTELPEEEFVLMAHLDHYRPGANDNASGSAVLLEAGRAILALVERGVIEPPRRTIRFLWVPEVHGTVPYLAAHPEAFGRMKGVLNFDMVGARLERTNSRFYITKTPHSLPTYFDDVIEYFVEYTRDANRESLGAPVAPRIVSATGSRSTFDASIEGYSGGSDHYIFTDGAISVPAVMFGTWPDVNYHTNEDTPDKVDPTTLKRVLFMGVTSTVTLASLGEEDVPMLASEVMARAQIRLGSDERKAYAMLHQMQESDVHRGYIEARNIIHQSFLREEATLRSCGALAGGDQRAHSHLTSLTNSLSDDEKTAQRRLRSLYREGCDRIGTSMMSVSETGTAKRLRNVIPMRVMDYRGPIGAGFLENRLGDAYDPARILLFKDLSAEDVVWFGSIPYETLNFVDGKRSIADIRDAISAEFVPVSLEAVEDYLNLLKRAGIVTF